MNAINADGGSTTPLEVRPMDWTKIPMVPARHFYHARTSRIQLLVIHTAETPEVEDAASRVAIFFQRGGNPGSPASAHYCIDHKRVIQCVKDADTAWAAKGANANGLHFEMAGRAGQSASDWMDAYSIAVMQNTAMLVARKAKEHGIPIQRAIFQGATPKVTTPGICGHVDVPGHGSHTDPGVSFRWTDFMQLVETYHKLL